MQHGVMTLLIRMRRRFLLFRLKMGLARKEALWIVESTQGSSYRLCLSKNLHWAGAKMAELFVIGIIIDL